MERRALITGGQGFAGAHLVAHLEQAGWSCFAPSHEELDLLDAGAVAQAVADLVPSHVFHLAALASVHRAWQTPREVVLDNLGMAVNLLEAVREQAPQAHILLASSGEIYGPAGRLPIDEATPLRPQNPYAVSKAACDLLGAQYADAHSLHVVRTRAFNHSGPGQPDDYVVSALARQIAQAEREGASVAVVRTGNPDAARDFTDVRDVGRAYAAAIELQPGVYNVCSGRAVTVRELIDLLRELTPLRLEHQVEASRMRPVDVPTMYGTSQRLQDLTGWKPQITLKDTLRDVLEAWRAELGAAQPTTS